MLVPLLLLVVACACSSTGLLLLKQSADTENELPLLQRRLWLGGFLMLAILPTVLNLYTYAQLPITVIAPFAGLTIALTLLGASTGLICTKELLSLGDCVATFVIIVGVGLASGFGPPEPDEPMSTAWLSRRFGSPTVIAFIGTLFALPLLLVAISAPALDPGPKLRTGVSAISAAGMGAVGTTSVKLLSSAIALIPTEGALEVASQPGVWLSLACAAVGGPLQFLLLTATLGSGSVAYAVPLYQTSLILLTTTYGGTFFEELNQMRPDQATGFVIGVLTCIGGLVLLAHAAGAAVTPAHIGEDETAPPPPKLPDLPEPTLDERLAATAPPLPPIRDARLRTSSIAGFVPLPPRVSVALRMDDGARRRAESAPLVRKGIPSSPAPKSKPRSVSSAA